MASSKKVVDIGQFSYVYSVVVSDLLLATTYQVLTIFADITIVTSRAYTHMYNSVACIVS